MDDCPCKITEFTVGRMVGASPSENRYYVLVLFDISDAKKYRLLIRVLKRYALRIQKSVFEGRLRQSQIKEMKGSIQRLMLSNRYGNDTDSVRIYTISGNCRITSFGKNADTFSEENVFL